MANSINKYISQYNKNIIYNLSDHKLTEDGSSILTAGLSFVCTPTKTFKKDINKSWNKFKIRILTQCFFFRKSWQCPTPPLSRGNPVGYNTYKPFTYNLTSAVVNDAYTLIVNDAYTTQHISDKATKDFTAS